LEFVVGPFIDKNGESFGPFDTAVEYYQYKARKIRGRFHKWLAPPHTPEDIEHADELCRLYDSVAGQLSDFDDGSFPVIHRKFGMDSLLYGQDELDLVAVIHWDKAHTGPWLEFAQYPAYLGIELGRLAGVIDCPGVRVSEFFVRFGKPEAGVDVQTFLKYVKDWKPDWEEFEPMQIENGE
jgi:hypothetical protein